MTPPPTAGTSVDLPLYTLRHGLARQQPSAPRVLVMDPTPELRIGLAELLRSYGMQVLAAGTVPEAIETTMAQRPTVVIADPRGYGIGVIGELHQVDPRLPVIVHSAIGYETQGLVLHYGGFALLTKGETAAAYLLAVITDAHTVYTSGPPRC